MQKEIFSFIWVCSNFSFIRNIYNLKCYMTRRFYLENSYLINLNNWLMCKKKFLVDSYPEAMSYKQLTIICRRKISLSQGKAPYWLSSAEWPALESYIHSNKNELSNSINSNTNNNQRKSYHLERGGEGLWRIQGKALRRDLR